MKVSGGKHTHTFVNGWVAHRTRVPNFRFYLQKTARALHWKLNKLGEICLNQPVGNRVRPNPHPVSRNLWISASNTPVQFQTKRWKVVRPCTFCVRCLGSLCNMSQVRAWSSWLNLTLCRNLTSPAISSQVCNRLASFVWIRCCVRFGVLELATYCFKTLTEETTNTLLKGSGEPGFHLGESDSPFQRCTKRRQCRAYSAPRLSLDVGCVLPSHPL